MRYPLRPIEDQVVAIVGASSGIGRQTARRFAERGATLILAARDDDALEEVRQETSAAGARGVIVVAGDVVDPAAMQAVARPAADQLGRLHTWVHVAGVELWSRFEDMTPDEFRRVVEVNLLGPVHGAMAALPGLRAAGGGALIVVSSVEAELPLPYQSAYAASKHGVNGWLRSLRMELERESVPVAVTQIQPAVIDTPIFRVARTRIGVEPRAVPPVYDPDIVATLIVHAAEHPSRDLMAGGAGWLLATAHRFAPRPTEAFLVRTAAGAQRSDRPKGLAAPDNLHQPYHAGRGVRGGFGGRRFSLLDRLETAPVALRAAIVAVVGGVAILGLRRRTCHPRAGALHVRQQCNAAATARAAGRRSAMPATRHDRPAVSRQARSPVVAPRAIHPGPRRLGVVWA